MPNGIRKGVALHPHATIVGLSQPTYYDIEHQFNYFSQTNSDWVRLWADWSLLQPDPPADPNNPTYDNWAWDKLDAEVQAANSSMVKPPNTSVEEPLKVILTVWTCPLWASPNTRSQYPSSDGQQYYRPDNTGVSSPYGRLLEQLMVRYHPLNPNRRGTIWGLEIVNEPNGQMKPQTGMANAVADMMVTAKQIKLNHGWTNTGPVLLAPALVDYREGSFDFDPSNPNTTTIGSFAESLLNRLDAIGFSAGPWIAWSQHNHLDIEADRLYADTALKYIGDKLAGHGWGGWRAPGDNGPRIFLTEGAARLTKIDSHYFSSNGSPSQLRNKQATLVENAKGRIMGGPYPAMWLYYGFTSNVDYDAGLRDPYSYPTQGDII